MIAENGLVRRSSATVAMLFAALALTGCEQAQKGFEDGFEKEFVRTFVPSCVASATGSGAPAELAQNVCGCAADDLVERYSASELMDLTPEEAKPAMESCARKNGLPI